ncbi:hypothetical protein PMKS-001665 [Pichia membranifaciens]|uniref:Uncharacterized protein n=1 Tax=Pichia membranifaciens TaxID=4926 RepID=A0A1Q2YFC4_9ASCO|nr:hypothetical protein PMKS-001665 [Pichia membranifaciens]
MAETRMPESFDTDLLQLDKEFYLRFYTGGYRDRDYGHEFLEFDIRHNPGDKADPQTSVRLDAGLGDGQEDRERKPDIDGVGSRLAGSAQRIETGVGSEVGPQGQEV